MPGPIFDAYSLTLLRAALANGEKAGEAYRAWRRLKPLDAIGFTEIRILPLLVQTALQQGIDDPDIERIKGASKHTWIRNVMRGRVLSRVVGMLASRGIPTVLLKGAALFTRYPDLAKFRGTGDFDLLVPRSDARRVIEILSEAGFAAKGVRLDLFTDSDFDLIHSLSMALPSSDAAIDLHWWPLPNFADVDYSAAIFDRADTGWFDNAAVKIPSLVDHLFLALARPTFDDQDETLLRAVEATLLLCGCGCSLDWELFIRLCEAHGAARQAGVMLDVIRSELDVNVPETVIMRLRSAPMPAAAIGLDDRSDIRDIWNRESRKTITFERPPIAYIRGLSIPEDNGRWTNGHVSVFAVLVGSVGVLGGQVQFEARPYVPQGTDPLELELYGGRGPIQHVVLTARDQYPKTIIAPVQTVGEDESVALVVVKVRNPRSPRMLGLAEDPRELGIMIRNVKWV